MKIILNNKKIILKLSFEVTEIAGRIFKNLLNQSKYFRILIKINLHQINYTEKDEKTGEEREVKERSHVVTSGKKGKRKFKKEVKKLGKKYGQDSVIVQTKGGGDATLKRSRKGGLPKRNIKLGKMKPGGKSKEGETQVKGKTYTYEKDD